MLDLYDRLQKETYTLKGTRVAYVPVTDTIRIFLMHNGIDVVLSVKLNEAKTYYHVKTYIITSHAWLNKSLEWLFDIGMQMYILVSRCRF